MQSSHSDYQQANLLSWQQQQNLPQLTAMQLSDRDPSVTIDDLTMSGRMEDEDPENFSGHPNKKSGRRKIKIEYITDKSRRHITFSKRKAGIMKKAYELSTLTGTQLLLLVVSETGLVYTFTTPKLQPLVTKPEGKNLIQSCLNAPDPLMNEASPSSATATIAAINKMTTPLETSTDLKEYQSSLDNNFNPNQMQQSQSMLSNSSNPDILTSPIPSNGSILNPNFRGSDQAVASIYDSNNKVFHSNLFSTSAANPSFMFLNKIGTTYVQMPPDYTSMDHTPIGYGTSAKQASNSSSYSYDVLGETEGNNKQYICNAAIRYPQFQDH